MGGKQKIKKSTNTENNGLKKKRRPHNTLPTWFQLAATLRLHELCEPMYVCMSQLSPKQTALSWTLMHGKTNISLLLNRLNWI